MDEHEESHVDGEVSPGSAACHVSPDLRACYHLLSMCSSSLPSGAGVQAACQPSYFGALFVETTSNQVLPMYSDDLLTEFATGRRHLASYPEHISTSIRQSSTGPIWRRRQRVHPGGVLASDTASMSETGLSASIEVEGNGTGASTRADHWFFRGKRMSVGQGQGDRHLHLFKALHLGAKPSSLAARASWSSRTKPVFQGPHREPAPERAVRAWTSRSMKEA